MFDFVFASATRVLGGGRRVHSLVVVCNKGASAVGRWWGTSVQREKRREGGIDQYSA